MLQNVRKNLLINIHQTFLDNILFGFVVFTLVSIVHSFALHSSYDRNKYLIIVGVTKSENKEQINNTFLEAEISLNNIKMCHA